MSGRWVLRKGFFLDRRVEGITTHTIYPRFDEWVVIKHTIGTPVVPTFRTRREAKLWVQKL